MGNSKPPKNQTNNQQKVTSHNTSLFQQDALCILPNIQFPLKVKVYQEPNHQHVDQEMIQILIFKGDQKILKRHYKIISAASKDNRFVVPKKCLIFPAAGDNMLKRQEQVSLSDGSHGYAERELSQMDIVVWAVASEKISSQLITCTVIAKRDTKVLVSAINAPLNLKENFPKFYPQDVGGWRKVYEVSMNDIYLWEDVSKAQVQVHRELSYKTRNKHKNSYEFVYTKSEGCNILAKAKSVVEIDAVNEIVHSSSQSNSTTHSEKIATPQGIETEDPVGQEHTQVPKVDVATPSGNNDVEQESMNISAYLMRRIDSGSNKEPKRVILFAGCLEKIGTLTERLVDNGIDACDIIEVITKNSSNVVATRLPICDVKFEVDHTLKLSLFEVVHVCENDAACTKDFGSVFYIPADLLSPGNRQLRKYLRIQNDASSTPMVITPTECEVTKKPLEEFNLKCMGIEGKDNSCYIDATLFALYAFTTRFDGGLAIPINETADKGLRNKFRSLLKSDIVEPLRKPNIVNATVVYKLREKMAEILNDNTYLGDFNDVETFLAQLFSEVLNVPEFFELGPDSKDYLLQIFPPGDENVKEPSVQYLIDDYFTTMGIKLSSVPETGLLLKLPVSDGVRNFENVYPNTELCLQNIAEEEILSEDNTINVMTLRAVICQKNEHFTTFVRIKSQTGYNGYVWIYHDSLYYGKDEPLVTECADLEYGMEIYAPRFNCPPSSYDDSLLSEDGKTWARRLLETAYICIYEPDNDSTSL